MTIRETSILLQEAISSGLIEGESSNSHQVTTNMDKEKDTEKSLDEAIVHGNKSAAQILIENGADLKLDDNYDRSCLHIAIDNKQSEIVELLLANSKWEDLLRKRRRKNGKTCSVTPFQELLKANMIGPLKLILDKCIKPNRKLPADHVDYEELYDFKYLDEFQSCAGGASSCWNRAFCTNNSNHPLSLMIKNLADSNNRVNHAQMTMLSHRLVQHFLFNKWISWFFCCFFTEIAAYAGFAACLIAYAEFLPPPYDFPSFASQSEVCHKKPHFDLLFNALLAFTLLNLIKEIFQLFIRGPLAYILSLQNWIETSTYIFTLLFMFNVGSQCPYDSGMKTSTPWIFGVIACFLSWINVIFLLNKNPALAIYVDLFFSVLNMFYNVFFFIFLYFILAFAVAFHMLFKNQAPFKDYGASITKTLVMMIGEFDYMTMFHSNETEYSSETPNGNVHFPLTGRIFFWLFATTMTILIMNMLVALSVDKISSFQNLAKLKQLKRTVQLIVEFEYMKLWLVTKIPFLQNPQRILNQQFYIVRPNEKRSDFLIWLKRLLQTILPLFQEIDFEFNESEKVNDIMEEKLRKLTTAIEQLQSQQSIIFDTLQSQGEKN